MGYFKNRVKKEVDLFQFEVNGQPLTDDFFKQYKNIKKLFKKSIIYLKNFESTYIQPQCNENLLKKGNESHLKNHHEQNTKKLGKKTNKTKEQKNKNIDISLSETNYHETFSNDYILHLEACLQDVLNFYDACCVFMLKIFKEIFRKPLTGKKQIFMILEKLFKMYYIFDITRHNHADIFHNLSLLKIQLNKKRETEHHDSYENLLLSRASFFSALSTPMGHLFISGFSTTKEEIFTPIELLKRTTIDLDSHKKEHVYFIASLVCEHEEFRYSAVFFAALYNRFFYSRGLIKQINRLDEQKQAYYVALTNIA